jgi:uncharacterized membrane-anchored protein
MSTTKRSYLVIGFCVLALIQICVPLSMIARREATLRQGTAFRFQTRPVDPYDAFRGRYVALQFVSDTVPTKVARSYERGQMVFVSIEEGTNGYAKLSGVSADRPQDGHYLRTKVRYHAGNSNLHVNLPFNRFYMNERDAPEAEIQFRRRNQRGIQRKAHALVKVRSGMAVIDDLYIEELPILEFLKKQKSTKP